LKCVNSAIFLNDSVGYRKKDEEIIGAGGKGSQGRGKAACWSPVLAQRAA
jgi:hypothetical protein